MRTHTVPGRLHLMIIAALMIGLFGAAAQPAAAQALTISILDATAEEPTLQGQTRPMSFEIKLSAPAPSNMTVLVSSADDTAIGVPTIPGAPTDLEDYKSVTPGTVVTIGAGSLGTTFDITLLSDNRGTEPDETFFMVLSSPSIGTIADDTAIGTIWDVPTVSIKSVSALESAGTMNFQVSLNHQPDPTTGFVDVLYAAFDESATDPADYTACASLVPGIDPDSMIFNVGDPLTQDIICTINNDTLDEPNETFRVEISAPLPDPPGDLVLGQAVAVGTIIDDDGPSGLSIVCPATVSESAGSANCTVTLAPVSGQTVEVTVSTSPGPGANPATPGLDYTTVNQVLSFPAGTASLPVSIPIIGDTVDEFNETFSVSLSGPSNATIATGSATVTITDNDATPNFRVNDATVLEGDAPGTVNMVFTVSLSAPSGRETSVRYFLEDELASPPAPPVPSGTVPASVGADYVDEDQLNNTLIFPAGVTSQNITVVIKGDAIDEFNETLRIVLDDASNAFLSPTQSIGTGTILDNDQPPSLSVDDITVIEGNAGSVQAVFSISLSSASAKTVTVDYATDDGLPPPATNGAVAPADYLSESGTLTFSPGDTSETVSVTVNGDTISENNELFFLNLSGPSNATLADPQGSCTIIDGDSGPTVSVVNKTVSEGNGVSVTLIQLQLSDPSGKEVRVSYSTEDGTAQSNLTSGAIPPSGDYKAVPSTEVIFAPGTTLVEVPIEVRGDALDEDNETVSIVLAGAVNANIAGNGTLTINDDDAPPVVSIGDATNASEGNAGQTTSAVFVIGLSAESGREVTVVFSTADGTATGGSDFVTDSRTVTFAPGATTQTVSIAVIGDNTDEPNETFKGILSTPVNATLGRSTGTATIYDDDGPTISIGDYTEAEGNSGTKTFSFTVSLSGATSFPVSVSYATADGSATAPSDYVARSGTVTFADARSASQVVAVTVKGDTIPEPDEDFFVNLSSPTGGAAIGDGQGRGVILNDETVTVSLSCPVGTGGTVSINEGNSGTSSLSCTVALSQPSDAEIRVGYTTTDGTATAPQDYISAVDNPIVFAPGQVSQTVLMAVNGDKLREQDENFTLRLSSAQTVSGSIGIPIIGDKVREGNEYFWLNLKSPIGAALDPQQSQVKVTIIDDDDPAQFTGKRVYMPLIINRVVGYP